MALRHDSSRDLLEELEDGWGAAPTPAGGISLSGGPQANAKAEEPPSESAPAEAGADDLPTHTTSSPDLKSLDDGWLDDLFPGEEPDDDDDDEPEPELPDERLDPEAFALAKKARDERAAKKKDKKRSKADAKRARQKARAEAMRQKQKAKKARPAAQARKVPEPSRKKTARNTNVGEDRSASADTAREEAAEERATSRSRAKAVVAPRRAPSTLASVKLLAVVLAILLALAAAVAAIVK